MTLRTRLLLGLSVFVGALVALGGWSAWHLWQMSALSERIIAENYDSVVAAQDMKESLERQDSAALFVLMDRWERALPQVREHRERFDAAHRRAAGNITEAGESDAVTIIGATRDEYYRRFDRFLSNAKKTQGSADADHAKLVTDEYFGQVEPLFNELRRECDRLLSLNQDAMRRKAADAASIARRWFVTTVGIALALALVGTWFAILLSNSLVRPVRQLTYAAEQMAAGHLDAAVDIHSRDEIGILAAQFNEMAARLRELRQSDLGKILVAQQMAEATVDSLYDPVIVTDGAGRVQRVNRAAETLFGPQGSVLGRPIQGIAKDPRLAMAVLDVLQSQKPVASEERAAIVPLKVDGVERSFRQRTTPMHDASDRLAGAVTLLEDITHLREVDRLKSEFIAGASHELRTPLTSIELGVHLLLEGSAGQLSSKQRELLAMCQQDVMRLDKLVKELLDLSRIESGEAPPHLATVRVHDLIVGAVEPLRRQADAKRLTLSIEPVPRDLPRIAADRSQLERVITNLVTNAIRATETGGSIALSAALRQGFVAISVRDTGRGIPPDSLDRIFEPFVQIPNAPAGGAGLGLSISRRIVQAHGGQLAVRSRLGQGTMFTFTVPVAADAAA
jgi:two-component system, NtrC family, sensor histidine kinase KinB